MVLSCVAMRLLPLQWAAIALIVLDATVLPEWWNYAVVPTSATLLALMLVRHKGSLAVDGYWTLGAHLRESLPIWAIALAALAFLGGISTMSAESPFSRLKYENGQYTMIKRKVVTVLTEEQYDTALAARQRFYTGGGLMIVGGALALAGVVRRIEETSWSHRQRQNGRHALELAAVHGQQHGVLGAAEVQHHEVGMRRVVVGNQFDPALLLAEDDPLVPDDLRGTEEQLALLPATVEEDVAVTTAVIITGRPEELPEHAPEHLEQCRHADPLRCHRNELGAQLVPVSQWRSSPTAPRPHAATRAHASCPAWRATR